MGGEAELVSIEAKELAAGECEGAEVGRAGDVEQGGDEGFFFRGDGEVVVSEEVVDGGAGGFEDGEDGVERDEIAVDGVAEVDDEIEVVGVEDLDAGAEFCGGFAEEIGRIGVGVGELAIGDDAERDVFGAGHGNDDRFRLTGGKGIVQGGEMKVRSLILLRVVAVVAISVFVLDRALAEDLGAGPITSAGGSFLLGDRQTVLFLGDSITAAGTYIEYADAYVRTRFPEWDVEMVNFGVGSETASGLSEPDHPFPRPCVHGRLGRVLEVVKPDVTVVCYGMNDGIYYPFGEERFAAYREGIERLIGRLRAAGSKVILMTPPPFDAVQKMKKEKLLPAGEEEYSYKDSYEGYDEVLARYGEWVLERAKKDDVVLGVDLYTPMKAHLDKGHGEGEGFDSGDGIHPAAGGHLLMAVELLKGLGAPPVVAAREVDLSQSGEVTFSAVPLPFPRDPRWASYGVDLGEVDFALNRFQITVKGEVGNYKIMEGENEVGTAKIDGAWGAVINLADLPDLSVNKRAGDVLALVSKRQQLVAKGCGAQIGEFRAKGTLPEGKAKTLGEILKEAEVAKLEEEIRKRTGPGDVALKFEKIGREEEEGEEEEKE